MTDIKEMLGDVAEQAKVYDVSGPVLHAARRQRRARWLAPVAAAAAVATLATVGWVVWPMAGGRTTPDAADEGRNVADLAWLPTKVRPPAAPPPVLPTGRAVGPAALGYASCEAAGCYAYLLTSDGTQYRLTEVRQPKATVMASVSLSRDGRWLGQRAAGEYLLRDLTGVRTHRIPGTLRPNQSVERFIDTLPTPDGTGVVVRTMHWWENGDGSGQGTAGDFFRVTWRGQVNRYEMPVELPREQVNQDVPTDEWWAKNGERWSLAGQFGKDLLLRHHDNANADLQALDTRTGELRTVCSLPKGITELFVQRGW